MSFNIIHGFGVSPSVGVVLSRHMGDSAVTVGRVAMSDSVVQKVSKLLELIGVWFGLTEVVSEAFFLLTSV